MQNFPENRRQSCSEMGLSTKDRRGGNQRRTETARRTEKTTKGGRELAHFERLNSCLCLFDEGRRGRYLSGYICARFEVEALNQGPACFGWRLTNEPMTTSSAWLRSLALSLRFSLPYPVSLFRVLSCSRGNKTIIYSSARESTDGIRTDRADTIYAVSRPTWWKDDRGEIRRRKTEEDRGRYWWWRGGREWSLLHVTEN